MRQHNTFLTLQLVATMLWVGALPAVGATSANGTHDGCDYAGSSTAGSWSVGGQSTTGCPGGVHDGLTVKLKVLSGGSWTWLSTKYTYTSTVISDAAAGSAVETWSRVKTDTWSPALVTCANQCAP